MTRWIRHPLFAPIMALAVLGWGTAVIAFLLAAPDLGPWATAVLTWCFGWDALTRAYRLDTVLLVTLQPPLFALVLGTFYADEIGAFLRRAGGRLAAGVAVTGFVAAAASLVLGGQVADGAPRVTMTPPREDRATPRVELTDHRRRPLALGEPTGRPAALTFIYASCHATCPALVATLRSTETLVGDGVDFLAVTLDPERDTPAALADYAERWQLGDRWRLLTGPAAAVDALREAHGVRVERRPDGEIGHDNVIVLLDRRGRAAYTWRGIGQPPENLARALKTLASERAT
jgi:protein SCO1/2